MQTGTDDDVAMFVSPDVPEVHKATILERCMKISVDLPVYITMPHTTTKIDQHAAAVLAVVVDTRTMFLGLATLMTSPMPQVGDFILHHPCIGEECSKVVLKAVVRATVDIPAQMHAMLEVETRFDSNHGLSEAHRAKIKEKLKLFMAFFYCEREQPVGCCTHRNYVTPHSFIGHCACMQGGHVRIFIKRTHFTAFLCLVMQGMHTVVTMALAAIESTDIQKLSAKVDGIRYYLLARLMGFCTITSRRKGYTTFISNLLEPTCWENGEHACGAKPMRLSLSASFLPFLLLQAFKQRWRSTQLRMPSLFLSSRP